MDREEGAGGGGIGWGCVWGLFLFTWSRQSWSWVSRSAIFFSFVGSLKGLANGFGKEIREPVANRFFVFFLKKKRVIDIVA